MLCRGLWLGAIKTRKTCQNYTSTIAILISLTEQTKYNYLKTSFMKLDKNLNLKNIIR